jgi:hypothetical protein
MLLDRVFGKYLIMVYPYNEGDFSRNKRLQKYLLDLYFKKTNAVRAPYKEINLLTRLLNEVFLKCFKKTSPGIIEVMKFFNGKPAYAAIKKNRNIYLKTRFMRSKNCI